MNVPEEAMKIGLALPTTLLGANEAGTGLGSSNRMKRVG